MRGVLSGFWAIELFQPRLTYPGSFRGFGFEGSVSDPDLAEGQIPPTPSLAASLLCIGLGEPKRKSGVFPVASDLSSTRSSMFLLVLGSYVDCMTHGKERVPLHRGYRLQPRNRSPERLLARSTIIPPQRGQAPASTSVLETCLLTLRK